MSLSCYSGGERMTLIWITFYSEWIFVYLMNIWLRKYYYTSNIIVSVLRNQAVELPRGEKQGGNSINYAEGKPPKAGMWRNKVKKIYIPSAVEFIDWWNITTVCLYNNSQRHGTNVTIHKLIDEGGKPCWLILLPSYSLFLIQLMIS